MNYTYILRCGDGSLYTGWTNNLEKRLEELLLKQNSTTATMLGLHNSPASGAPEEEDKND